MLLQTEHVTCRKEGGRGRIRLCCSTTVCTYVVQLYIHPSPPRNWTLDAGWRGLEGGGVLFQCHPEAEEELREKAFAHTHTHTHTSRGSHVGKGVGGKKGVSDPTPARYRRGISR